MTDDALSRAKKALSSPKGGAVVPAGKSGRDLIALAKAAAQRPASVQAAPADERKGSALIVRVKEAAARPIGCGRPVVQIPEPAKADAMQGVYAAAKGRTDDVRPMVPVVAPAPVPTPVPTRQVVPVQIAPGQIVPVEIPQNAPAGGQPIVVNVNVVNEQPGPYWGPYYWGLPYYIGCGRVNCPHLRGLLCNRWRCR